MKGKQIKLDSSFFSKLFYLFLVVLYSCQNKQINRPGKWSANKNDSLSFKEWAADTLSHLKSMNNSRNVFYNVPEDSTYFEIQKKYKFGLADTNSTEKDINLAFLLLRNEKLFSDRIKLIELTTSHQYSVSQVHLKYEYIYEITNFIVYEERDKFKLRYIKGNLVDLQKEAIK